jgi:tetratricopeptide (TPR) repeat protein
MRHETPWETGHVTIAERYYEQKDYTKFLKEMNAVIAERPFNYDTYKYTIKQLADAGQFDLALPLLLTLDKQKSDEFTTKGIGQIFLVKQDYQKCIVYLEKFLSMNSTDAQALYNISGAYFYTKQYDKAMDAIKRCIQIAPQNRMAIEFYNQLKTALGR